MAEAARERRQSRRVARTKGVSLLPAEFDDLSTVEEMTGVGLTEAYRRFLAPQMRAAADVLREAREAGMEMNRAVLRVSWDTAMSPEELSDVFRASSVLRRGD